MKNYLIILLLFSLNTIPEKGFSQNHLDSLKFLKLENTIMKNGILKIRTKEFSNYKRMKIVLENDKVCKGIISKVTDSTFIIGERNLIKISNIIEISRKPKPFLLIGGGSVLTLGILSALINFRENYYYSHFNDYKNEMLPTILMVSVGGIGTISGIVEHFSRKHYSTKKGWKIKTIKKPNNIHYCN
ncbi:MAG: hypothetical protein HXX09_04545 [Bacteroidetes bacterium]|nr:hypothetical protein [Bacteroidota bacterium]